MSWSLIISLTLALLLNGTILFWGKSLTRGYANLITGFFLGGSMAMAFGATVLASCRFNLFIGITIGGLILATVIAATLTIRRGGFYFPPLLAAFFVGICFYFATHGLSLFLPGVRC
jgi:hypothetical protein